MNKIKLIVLLTIVSILITGCVQAPTPAPKLKIMSVTAGQATLVQIPMTIKIKNIGDAIAKDVYVGGINVCFLPKTGNFTNRSGLIEEGISHVLTSGRKSYIIDTGIPNPDYNGNPYNLTYPDFVNPTNLSVGTDTPESTDYLGEISPGEVKEGHTTVIASSAYGGCIYNKVAWTDDKKEITIY